MAAVKIQVSKTFRKPSACVHTRDSFWRSDTGLHPSKMKFLVILLILVFQTEIDAMPRALPFVWAYCAKLKLGSSVQLPHQK